MSEPHDEVGGSGGRRPREQGLLVRRYEEHVSTTWPTGPHQPSGTGSSRKDRLRRWSRSRSSQGEMSSSSSASYWRGTGTRDFSTSVYSIERRKRKETTLWA